jgi:hypothetical protein
MVYAFMYPSWAREISRSTVGRGDEPGTPSVPLYKDSKGQTQQTTMEENNIYTSRFTLLPPVL